MIFGINNLRTPEEIEEFRNGYDKCFNDFIKIVKKLGKKYYKEFIDEAKNIHKVGYTATTHTHKCNCKYCNWDIKED